MSNDPDDATTRAVIAEIQRKSATTLAAIAQEIEARGMRTPARRSTWQPVQLSRLPAHAKTAELRRGCYKDVILSLAKPSERDEPTN